MTINGFRKEVTAIDTTVTEAPSRPPLRRRQAGKLLTGVAVGVAEHLRVRPIYVRLALVALSLPWFDSIGVLLYVALWAVLPSETSERPWRDRQQWPVFAALGLGLLIFTLTSSLTSSGMLFGWVAALVALGAGFIWHQIKPEAVVAKPAITPNSRRDAILRLGGGGLLVATGVVGTMVVLLGLDDRNVDSILNSVIFTVIALAGMGLVFGPLAWRTMDQLRDEREARVREAERADIAAMVHDQVLHTLALIQRRADDTREVVRLARGQERALRNWLYKPRADAQERLQAALEAASAEVEDSFAIGVDAVVVGDCDLDPHSAALVAAAREAMVNAAKHAGVDTISLYAEVEEDQISVFIRDRGAGFNPDDVDTDRHGVRGSIMDRMLRHGGRAEVRSTVGEGTEVRLHMPRAQQETGQG